MKSDELKSWKFKLKVYAVVKLFILYTTWWKPIRLCYIYIPLMFVAFNFVHSVRPSGRFSSSLLIILSSISLLSSVVLLTNIKILFWTFYIFLYSTYILNKICSVIRASLMYYVEMLYWIYLIDLNIVLLVLLHFLLFTEQVY